MGIYFVLLIFATLLEGSFYVLRFIITRELNIRPPPPSEGYAPNVTNAITAVEGVASFSLFPKHK